jgi:hypothetical protein
MMNGQQEDAMATATVPIPEATSEREQRHCPECGSIYECSPRWRHRICPSCDGQRVAQARVQRGGAAPPAPLETVTRQTAALPTLLDILDESSPLDRELTALRISATLFEDLDSAARGRVMAWLTARYAEPTP